MTKQPTHNPSVEHHAASTPPQPTLPDSERKPDTDAERTGATPEMRDQKEDPKGPPHSDRHKMERAYIDHADPDPAPNKG